MILSVVVPAHNAEAFLPICLDALGSSDLARDVWEVVVVDDASTDSTPEIADRRADVVLRTGNVARGPAYARNRGAEAASGEFIAFIDADVAVHEDALRLLAAHLRTTPTLVAVFGSYDEQPADRSLVSRYRNLLHHYAHRQTAGSVATFWAGCGAVRASAFRTVGGFDEVTYARPQIEDIELGYRLYREGAILLDPAIQARHYKRWSVGSIMKTDFRDRAVPWVRLLLSAKSVTSASSPSLGTKALAGTAAAGSALVAVLLGCTGFGVSAWIAAAAFVGVSVAVNIPFYAWLTRHGGLPMLAVAIPLHFGYQLVSAVAVPVGGFYSLLDRRNRANG
ncbi:MAG TPA: glycosyltransferase family 2 protein [Gemmatimonadaceae bacterium]|nr:glycosyltransferase family 2 protein [Gemmatimonadaceae bacterium]